MLMPCPRGALGAAPLRSSSGCLSLSSALAPILPRQYSALAASSSNRCVGAYSSSALHAAGTPLDMVGWVKNSGGSVDGVTVANLSGRDGGSGWGMLSESDVAAGTKVKHGIGTCMMIDCMIAWRGSSARAMHAPAPSCGCIPIRLDMQALRLYLCIATHVCCRGPAPFLTITCTSSLHRLPSFCPLPHSPPCRRSLLPSHV